LKQDATDTISAPMNGNKSSHNGFFRLDGRYALVTGGASGIGAATCRVLAQAGAAVVIADIDAEHTHQLASEIPGSIPLVLDVTNPDAVAKAFQSIGKLDILVNNAGIGHVGNISETDYDDFQHLMGVNVTSMFIVTKCALPLLLASRGTIVNMASVAGLIGIKQRLAYCTSKGAVIAMTRQLAVDYPRELRVNCICPGTVDTPFVENYLEKFHRDEKDKVRGEVVQRQPMGRLGKPEEIACMVLYLCSDEAGFMNGSVLNIDGGWTAA
jgi:NAD(P)-dependent dehydrogenase (short-subunit alcohol dehydrogenase family)